MICSLCQNERELCESHIIPQFAFDWLKRSSATGYLRRTGVINRRVQDGQKQKLLCGSCETRISRYESLFAREVFHPLHTNEELRLSRGPWFRYDAWFMKFAVSVSWRALIFLLQRDTPRHFSEQQLKLASDALSKWRSFLLDLTDNPASFEQHVILMDVMADHTINDLPKNMNRYFLRTIDFDLARSERSAFVFVKMCRVMIFGFIQNDPKEIWEGTRLRVRKGEVGGKNMRLPGSLLNYLKARAKHVGETEAKISDRQLDKIHADTVKAGDRAIESETLAVTLHDEEMFRRDKLRHT